jgi:hypothetical protein
MNVIDELKLMNAKGYGDFFDYAMEQKEIWEKKLHIIKAVNVANEIENVINDGFFKAKGIDSITIEICYKGTHYYYFSMYDNDERVELKDEIELDPEPVAKIRGALNELHGLKLDYIGENFNQHVDVNSPNVRDTILNMLLNKELKNILDFSEMQCEIKDNKVENKNRKSKL